MFRSIQMKTGRKVLSGACLTFLISVQLMGSSDRITNVATTAAPFLEVGIGSRAIGMGAAFVGVANDISALYWNPAGLCRMEGSQAGVERIEWLAGTNLNFMGTAFPVGSGSTLGFFLNALSVPDMEVRTVDHPEGTGELFNAASLAAGITWSYPLTDRFSIGFTGKYISERLWHESASGLAVDIGTLYHTGIEGLRIGAVITNFGSSLQLSGSDLIIYHDPDPSIEGNNDRIMGMLLTDDWPLPLNMQLGIAWDLMNSAGMRLTWALDALHPINNTESLNTGVEFALNEMLFARAGYKGFGVQDSEEGLTLGTGLRYKMFGQSYISFDYAFADFNRLTYVHRFTLKFDL